MAPPAEAWGYNPLRLVSCTCGWAIRFTDLRYANRRMEEHEQEGTEGCDHAFHIETLSEKESR